MRHLSEEELVLRFYGEAEAPAALEAHLGECPVCRQADEALRLALTAADAWPAPERGEGYGAQVWARLAPRLEPRPAPSRRLSTRRGLLALLATAAALVAAFEAGRHWPGPPRPAPRTAAVPPVRERILLVAVGDHLRRSQMVLVELANAAGDGPVDVSGERALAGDLVADSRLYRQAAARAGETGLGSVLDELERVLVEVANGPSTLSSRQLDELRERIESKGILFKVRVLGSQVREREKEARARPGRST